VFARAAIARKENNFDRLRLLSEAATALEMDPTLAVGDQDSKVAVEATWREC
jgi:hypothetical protein